MKIVPVIYGSARSGEGLIGLIRRVGGSPIIRMTPVISTASVRISYYPFMRIKRECCGLERYTGD